MSECLWNKHQIIVQLVFTSKVKNGKHAFIHCLKPQVYPSKPSTYRVLSLKYLLF